MKLTLTLRQSSCVSRESSEIVLKGKKKEGVQIWLSHLNPNSPKEDTSLMPSPEGTANQDPLASSPQSPPLRICLSPLVAAFDSSPLSRQVFVPRSGSMRTPSRSSSTAHPREPFSPRIPANPLLATESSQKPSQKNERGGRIYPSPLPQTQP